MNRRLPLQPALALGLMGGLLALAAWHFWPAPAPPPDADGQAVLATLVALAADDARTATAPGGAPGTSDAGPAAAAVPAPLAWPVDQAPHPTASAEGWDLSGWLTDDRGRPFGLRLTLLRATLRAPAADTPSAPLPARQPVPDPPPRASAFATRDAMAARLTLLRPDGAPLAGVRAARLALGLAGAGDDLWVEDWRLHRDAEGRLHLTATLEGDLNRAGGGGGAEIALTLTPAPGSGPVSLAALAGEAPGRGAGTPRGPGAAAPRAYLQPRLAVAGRLTLAGRELAVRGDALLEHGWGDGLALLAGGRGQLALNRFTLILDDGSTLACMHLRRRTGGGTPVPTCLLIDGAGTTEVLPRRALTLEPVGHPWRNPADGGRWPLSWRLAVPDRGLDLRLQPSPGQPADALLGPLWSGLLSVSGRRGPLPVTGAGRMELGGYDGD